MNIPTTLQAMANHYGIPLTIVRGGREYHLFTLVAKDSESDHAFDAMYITPGLVHPVKIDINFGGDDSGD